MLALIRRGEAFIGRNTYTATLSRIPVAFMSQLCDCDANLFHPDLNWQECMQNAAAANVAWFVVPGSTVKDSMQSLQLAGEMSNVISTAGIHPYHVRSHSLADKASLLQLLSSSECSSVGECGLDYSPSFPTKEEQIPFFRMQLELCLQVKKPLFLHVRDAHADFMSILSEYGFCSGKPLPVNGLVHCFTGTNEELRQYVDLGFYIGLTGSIMSKTSDELGELLRIVPLDRLVVETDAPYMGFSGCRELEKSKKTRKYPNVPSALPKIVNKIAEILNMSYDEVAVLTTSNALTFFNRKAISI